MKFSVLLPSAALLLSANMAMAKVGSSCGGWIKETTKDQLGFQTVDKFLGQCGPREHCLDNICHAKVPRGGDCSNRGVCFSADYCDDKNVCRKKKKKSGSCARDYECESNVCAKGSCHGKGEACGSDADCKYGKVCLYASDAHLSTIERKIRTCQVAVNGNLGIKCSKDKDCTKCHEGQTLAQWIEEAKETNPALVDTIKKNASKFLAQQRQRQNKCHKTTKCQFDVCVEDNWFRGKKATTGFYCRSDADCQSGNCETTTHDDGKLTLKYCGSRKTSSRRR